MGKGRNREEQTMKAFDRSEVLDVTSACHAGVGVGAEEKRLRRARIHELLERSSGEILCESSLSFTL